MIKKKNTVLAICFALAIIATGCSGKSINNANTGVPVANGNAIGKGSAIDAGVSTPAPHVSPRTIQVRLTAVEMNMDVIDSPLPNSSIIIKSGETSVSKKTNDAGVALFDAVPCGNEIVITAVNDDEGGDDGVFRRNLECKGTEVDLGVINKAFGGKYTLEQRKPQLIVYDVEKGVWLSNGKIVPNERIRHIFEEKQ